MPHSYLKLFGSPQLELGSKMVLFKDDKRFCLLAYLAYKADWVSREQLANLFWSDTDTSSARKNLRHLIGRTRAIDWLTGFDAELEHVRWQVQTDVGYFQNALEASSWDEALAFYKGALLDGFQADDSPEFADWLESERASQQERWHTASLKQARVLHDCAAHSQALQILEGLLKHDPLDENALDFFMRVATQAGQRSTALRTFESFATRLQHELNLPPPTHLEQLAQTLRGQQAIPVMVQTAHKPATTQPLKRPLPMIATAFVGRELVLGELTSLLERHESRLITLVGQGGVGKTRIALQIAHEQSGHQDVGFVNLVPLSTPSAIPSAIAETIGLTFQGKDSSLQQIIKHIDGRRILLVIDNFEHLIAGTPYIGEIRRECPNLTLLITSREPLGLLGEQVLPVEAFFVPETKSADFLEIQNLEAVQLFSQHARRVRPDFRLDENNIAQVLEICRLVDGLPLAIELAAVWVRALSLTDLAGEIAGSLDVLSSQRLDMVERHRSVRAAFEHSWKLLTVEEQQALRRLSVFRGGISREAVRQAAHIPLPVLGSLIDKSLLGMNTQGRYRRHRLLHQYMQEKLGENPEEASDARTSHGQYYFRLLQKGLEGIRGPNSRMALEELEVEFENIRIAWRWAIDGHRLIFLKAGAEALMRFFDARGRYMEAIDMFGEAIAQLEGSDAENQATLGTLLIHQSKFFERRSQLATAEQLARQGLRLLEPLNERETMIWGLGNLGTIAGIKADHDQAIQHREQALLEARALANDRLIAVGLGWVAISEAARGNVPLSTQHYREAIRLFKKLGNHIGALFNLNGLATTLLEAGNLIDACSLWLESYELAKTAGELSQIPFILADLGNCYHQLGNLDQALTYTQQSLEVERNQASHNLDLQTELLIRLAKISLTQVHPVLAKNYLAQALEHAWNAGELPAVMDTLLAWAELLEADDLALKARILSMVHQHPATRTTSREDAAKKLEALERVTTHSTNPLELETLILQLQHD